MAKWTTTTLTYLHVDHLGTPIRGTHGLGGSGTLNPGEESFQDFSTPYGLNPTSGWWGNGNSGFDPATGPGSNCGVTGFTTHAKDCESGLQYMQARHYSPVVARFMSVDPVDFMTDGRPGMVNRYGYTLGDPLNMYDPDGRNAVTKLIKQTIKRKGNIREAVFDVGGELVTVFAPSSTPIERLISAAELVSPVSPSDISDARKIISATRKRLGGRKGGLDTRAQNQAVANTIEQNGGQSLTGFNDRGPETYFANPKGGSKGGRYSDGTAVDADGNPLQVQTVDTYSDGSLTTRETSSALDIAERSGEPVVCISKTICS